MTTLALRVYHRPVMVGEAVQGLRVRPDGTYVDCTVGEGGHALAALRAAAPAGRLLGLDADPQALETARERLWEFRDAAVLARGNFANLARLARDHGFAQVDGILFDLGWSSLQVEAEGRGLSFQRQEPLDMRFDPAQELTAESIVNTWPEEELARIISAYGEEPRARRIARAITHSRPLSTSLALAQVVERAAGYRRGHIHPATRTFQALRIAVNGELDSLREALPQAVTLLKPGGRLVVIAYHSLEDRIVKEFLRRESRDCLCPPPVPACRCTHRATVRLVTRKVIVPSPAEVTENPRSRSARMRVAERLEAGLPPAEPPLLPRR